MYMVRKKTPPNLSPIWSKAFASLGCIRHPVSQTSAGMFQPMWSAVLFPTCPPLQWLCKGRRWGQREPSVAAPLGLQGPLTLWMWSPRAVLNPEGKSTAAKWFSGQWHNVKASFYLFQSSFKYIRANLSLQLMLIPVLKHHETTISSSPQKSYYKHEKMGGVTKQ